MSEVEVPASASGPASRERIAAGLRGFGPLGIVAILAILAGNLVVVPLGAVLVLVWARLSRTPWREIGYVQPASWTGTLVLGVVLGAGLKFLMKAVVMPLLGADPVNQAYHHLAGDRAAIPSTLYALVVGAGFGEETLFRGWMFERFGKLFGTGTGAKTATVIVTSMWFGLDHYQAQGLAGVEQATLVGLVFGTIFAVTGRIWLPMIAHAVFDLVAYAMIYWNLETAVAHLVF